MVRSGTALRRFVAVALLTPLAHLLSLSLAPHYQFGDGGHALFALQHQHAGGAQSLLPIRF